MEHAKHRPRGCKGLGVYGFLRPVVRLKAIERGVYAREKDQQAAKKRNAETKVHAEEVIKARYAAIRKLDEPRPEVVSVA